MLTTHYRHQTDRGGGALYLHREPVLVRRLFLFVFLSFFVSFRGIGWGIGVESFGQLSEENYFSPSFEDGGVESFGDGGGSGLETKGVALSVAVPTLRVF
jgi:hypothetical protein